MSIRFMCACYTYYMYVHVHVHVYCMGSACACVPTCQTACAHACTCTCTCRRSLIKYYMQAQILVICTKYRSHIHVHVCKQCRYVLTAYVTAYVGMYMYMYMSFIFPHVRYMYMQLSGLEYLSRVPKTSVRILATQA